MIDLMVSLAIVSVLIALMFPAISMVRESTRKVICGSNLRQVGLGISMFSQDRRDELPNSVFLPEWTRNTANSTGSFDRMDILLLPSDEYPEYINQDKRWDGLGKLFVEEYVSAPNTFYCPSHTGNFTFDQASERWMNPDQAPEIVANYLYRGMGPDGRRVLFQIDSSAALVTDTLRSYNDLNHEGGFNVLQAGLAVEWYEDIGDEIANDLLARNGDDNNSQSVQNAWGRLDDIPGEAD